MSGAEAGEGTATASGGDQRSAAPGESVPVTIRAKRVRNILLVVVTALVITGTAASFVSKFVAPHPEHKLTKLMNRFDINHEPSLPAWYSSGALLAASALLLLTGIARRQEGDGYYRHWLGLAAVFLLLSLDEAAMFHEGINSALWWRTETEGIFYFPWVIPALLFVGLVGLCYVPFLRHIERRTAALFVVAGGIYVMGAVGMEMSAGPLVEKYGEMSTPHMLCEVVEETLEMLGIVVFIYALLGHLARCVRPIRLQFV